MIATESLIDAVRRYGEYCDRRNKRPTYEGLSHVLGISAPTVAHVVSGYYANGKLYSPCPHPLRCIDNRDFPLVRELFE